jgi:hypothetical protein
MKLCGFQGWTSFWNVIYLDPDHMDDEKLIRHEKKHLEQIQEQGRLKFAVKYTYYTMRYGYRDNPYEIEAREAETSEG